MILVVGLGAALIAVPPPASAAAGLGDLIGSLLGGGQGESQPTPPKPRPPAVGDVGSPDRPPKDPLLAPESSCPGQSDPSLPVAAQERAMACMQSYARVANGLSPLRIYKPLRVSATHKARDIKRCQVLSHQACGRGFTYWISRLRVFKGAWRVGEILAVVPRETVRATMRRWLDSKPHEAVLMDGRFNLVGVGSARGRFRGHRGMRVWAAHFGYHR